MPNQFASCIVDLKFEFGRIDDRHMHLSVLHEDNSYILEPTFENNLGHANLSIGVKLPTVINFVVSNKGENDTIVDADGNVVADCYIKLAELSIDKFGINKEILGRRVTLTAKNGQIVNSNYMGFNGTAVLKLHKPDVFSQVLTLNRHND